MVDEEMHVLNTRNHRPATDDGHRSPLIPVAEPHHQDLDLADGIDIYWRWMKNGGYESGSSRC